MPIAATILLLSVSTAVAAERRGELRLPTAATVHAAQAAPVAAVDDSVAVTVFANISGLAADDWIGTGPAETLPREALRQLGTQIQRVPANRISLVTSITDPTTTEASAQQT